MRRSAGFVVGFVVLLASGAFAQTGVFVSGQPTIAVVDVDGNGPDNVNDCRFSAITNPMGDFTINSIQSNPALRACSGMYMGNVDPNFPTDTSVFGTFNMTTITGGIGFPNLPFSFDGKFFASNVSGPPRISGAELTNGNSAVVGAGTLCDASALVTLADGMTMRVALGTDTPGFVKVPKVPFELDDLSGFVMKDVYVPQTNGVITFAVGSPTSPPVLAIPLTGFCEHRAPSVSGWRLIVLAFGLLATGTWLLGRRRAFYDAVPLP